MKRVFIMCFLFFVSDLSFAVEYFCKTTALSNSGANPYKNNPTYESPNQLNNGTPLINGNTYAVTTNHVIPRGIINQIFESVTYAHPDLRWAFTHALINQFKNLIGPPTLEKANAHNNVPPRYLVKYSKPSVYTGMANIPDLVRYVNMLIRGYNKANQDQIQLMYVPGLTILSTKGFESLVHLVNQPIDLLGMNLPQLAQQQYDSGAHSESNLASSLQKIYDERYGQNDNSLKIIGGNEFEVDVNTCARFKGMAVFWAWNPTNLFHTPRSETRTWDPAHDNDPTDVLAAALTTIPYIQDHVRNLAAIGTSPLNPQTINIMTDRLAHAIHAMPNLLLEIPFSPNQWVYYHTPLVNGGKRVWCPRSIYEHDPNKCFVRN
jgi:hypothetical protein